MSWNGDSTVRFPGLMDSQKADLKDKNIGFIGAGVMAQAIAFSLLDAGIGANQIYASAPSYKNLQKWKEKGMNISTKNEVVVEHCDVTFLAMKPQYLDEAISSLMDVSQPRTKLFISILVGLPISAIKQKVYEIDAFSNAEISIIRVMPNTPIMVGSGCSLICHEPTTPKSDVELVKLLLSSGSLCEVVPEPLLNPLSAICGSGPAFVYLMIEALSDGAVKCGVPRDLAMRLTAQTMLGASKMVLKSGKHPGQLKDEVCSPGGSTIAGICSLEKSSVRFSLMGAVEATTKRAEEIAKKFT